MLYRFGLFEFDAGEGELRRQGRPVRLEPQPARALGLLLSRPGETVGRDEMRAHLWEPGTHVDFDRGLAYCIGHLRTVLGDTADNPRFVETLPKRGYRFIAPVQRLTSTTAPPTEPPLASMPAQTPSPGPPTLAPPAPALPSPMPVVLARQAADSGAAATVRPQPEARRSWWPVTALTLLVVTAVAWTAVARIVTPRPVIAVALFDNETGDPAFDTLAATAADVMVERLTALGPQIIGVIGNTPALRLPRTQRDPAAVQRESGAGFFVFGQVQPDDAGIRLVVHLVRLDDNTHLWVTRVARSTAALTDIENVVADRLVEAVRRHVLERDTNAPRFTP